MEKWFATQTAFQKISVYTFYAKQIKLKQINYFWIWTFDFSLCPPSTKFFFIPMSSLAMDCVYACM